MRVPHGSGPGERRPPHIVGAATALVAVATWAACGAAATAGSSGGGQARAGPELLTAGAPVCADGAASDRTAPLASASISTERRTGVVMLNMERPPATSGHLPCMVKASL